ncbi:MAG: hypothetical protein H6704_29400 [Myxococcales bacterium]|nr:hypothetical protein [Myxococcales bacterium]
MSVWGVIGDGPWGCALAARLAGADNDVRMVGLGKRPRGLPKAIAYSRDLGAVLDGAERLLVALPPSALEPALADMAPHLQGHHRVVTTARGLTPATHLRATEAFRTLTAVRQLAVLAGAADAEALMAQKPVGLVVGSAFPSWADEIQRSLASPTLRLYTNPDPIGVELANALAAVFGVAMGAARQAGVGPATESTALTRALAEMDRLVQGMGGRPNTAYGLAGLGVLGEIVFDGGGHAFQAGLALAKGDLDAACAHAEVREIARTFAARAERQHLRAPMVRTVDALFAGVLDAQEAVGALMSRAARPE